MKCALIIAGLIGLSTTVLVADEKSHPLKRWAVLASPKLQEIGLVDLVTAELSRVKDIDLVEREQLIAVAKELAVTQALGAQDVGVRLKLGSLLKADALVILSDVRVGEKDFVKLVISDTRCGARLRVVVLSIGEDARSTLPLEISKVITETRGRYPNGVQRVVGVTHFISKTLVHDFDYLQAGYSHLLESSFSALPNTAVLETEEAKAIQQELSIGSGDEIKRVVPFFIEGEFEVSDAVAKKNPKVNLLLRVRDGKRILQTLERNGLSFAEAETFFRQEARATVLRLPKDDLQQAIPAEEQFRLLQARADSFSRIGDRENSIGLREAALLLRPGDVGERVILIQDYLIRPLRQHWRVNPGDQKKSREEEKKLWHDASRERLLYWQRSVQHLEFLIRNRLVTMEKAMELCVKLFDRNNNLSLMFPYASELQEEVATHRRDFFLFVGPMILKLDQEQPGQGFYIEGLVRWQWLLYTDLLADFKFTPVEEFYSKTTLDSLRDFLLREDRDAPIPTSPVRYFIQNAASALHRKEKSPYRFSDSEFYEFLKDLEKSSSVRNKTYARVGLLQREWEKIPKEDKAANMAILAKAEALRKEIMEQVPREFGDRYEPDFLKEEWRDYADSLSGVIQFAKERIGKLTTPTVTQIAVGNPAQPVTPPSVSRLTLEQIPIQIKLLSGVVRPLQSGIGRGVDRMPLTQAELVPCGDALDVIRNGDSLLLHREKGLWEEIVHDKEAGFVDVKWDGKNIWVATLRQGIWVLATTGKIVAKIGKEQGLPPATTALELYPIAPNRMIAVGSFGRAWCAIVERVGDHGKVEVFHEATRQVTGIARIDGQESDPSLAFTPKLIQPYKTDSKGNTTSVVIREWERFLEVDIKSRKVSVLNLDERLGQLLTALMKREQQRGAAAEVTPSAKIILSLMPQLFDAAKSSPINRGAISQSGLGRPRSIHFFENGDLLIANSEIVVAVRQSDQSATNDASLKLIHEFSRPPVPSSFWANPLPPFRFLHPPFISYKDWIYLPGEDWIRIKKKTLDVEILASGQLPEDRQGRLRRGISAHFGLVAWRVDENRGIFYKVRVNETPVSLSTRTPVSPMEQSKPRDGIPRASRNDTPKPIIRYVRHKTLEQDVDAFRMIIEGGLGMKRSKEDLRGDINTASEAALKTPQEIAIILDKLAALVTSKRENSFLEYYKANCRIVTGPLAFNDTSVEGEMQRHMSIIFKLQERLFNSSGFNPVPAPIPPPIKGPTSIPGNPPPPIPQSPVPDRPPQTPPIERMTVDVNQPRVTSNELQSADTLFAAYLLLLIQYNDAVGSYQTIGILTQDDARWSSATRNLTIGWENSETLRSHIKAIAERTNAERGRFLNPLRTHELITQTQPPRLADDKRTKLRDDLASAWAVDAPFAYRRAVLGMTVMMRLKAVNAQDVVTRDMLSDLWKQWRRDEKDANIVRLLDQLLSAGKSP